MYSKQNSCDVCCCCDGSGCCKELSKSKNENESLRFLHDERPLILVFWRNHLPFYLLCSNQLSTLSCSVLKPLK